MNSRNVAITVTGAGGFIGGHLVADLLSSGAQVRAVDLKPFDEWYQRHDAAENLQLDLRLISACEEAVRGTSEVYNLAADMGGMGFIEHNKALCMLSVLINTHMLEASRVAEILGTQHLDAGITHQRAKDLHTSGRTAV